MLGVIFTDAHVQAVLAQGTGAKGSLQKVFTEKLPEGAVKNGMPVLPDAITEALRKIKKASGVSVMFLCLPPEYVYCVHFTVPAERGIPFAKRLTLAMSRHIPEKASALKHQIKFLKRSKEGTHVGVIAMRKEILQGWTNVCRTAGLTLKSVVSPALAKAPKQSAVVVTAGSSFKPTLTLFAKGWPIDEAVLSEEISDAAIADELKGFVEEYRAEFAALPIQVVGSADLLASVQGMLSPTLKGGKSKPKPPLSPSTGLFLWVKERDRPALGAIIASLSFPSRFNLLRNTKSRAKTVFLALLFVLGLCAATVAYFRPDLIPRW